MKPKQYPKMITFRLSGEDLERVEKVKEQFELTRSQVLRTIIKINSKLLLDPSLKKVL